MPSSRFVLIICKTPICEEIKRGNEKIWNVVWDLYTQFKNVYDSKELFIFQLLACSAKSKYLNRFLEWSLDDNLILKKDSLKAFQSLSSNVKGYEIMKKFFKKHNQQIISYHTGEDGTTVLSYLAVLFETITQQKQMDELIQMAKSMHLDLDNKDVKRSMKIARKSIGWFERNEPVFKTIFNVGRFW